LLLQLHILPACRTSNLTVGRRCFYDWREVSGEIIEFISRYGGSVDYVTFVPDGEPTLDACIGRVIEEVKKEVDVRIDVLTKPPYSGSMMCIEILH